MKLVIVSGSSRGIGFAVSKRLVNDGYHVLGLSRNISADFESLVAKKNLKGKAEFYNFDLNNTSEISSMANKVIKKYGEVFGLVNNAGIGLTGILATMHDSEISKLLRINLQSSILLSKYFCRPMIQKEEGRIINISSIIANTGFNGMAVYAASKAGLEGFSKSLSRELGKKNITVNCIAPGYLETEMTSGISLGHFNKIKKRAPLGLPQVDDIANATSYLLSDQSKKITGTVFTIDGGSSA